MIDKEKENELVVNPSRRSFLEAGSAALAAATFVGLTAGAQQREDYPGMDESWMVNQVIRLSGDRFDLHRSTPHRLEATA